MIDKMMLELAVPERRLVLQEVGSIQVRALDGYLGVLPGHAPLMTELGTGVLTYQVGDETRYMAVHGGIMEVLPDRVRILADRATPAEEVDLKRAETALQRAIDLLQRHDLETDVERAHSAIERARVRLEAYDRSQ